MSNIWPNFEKKVKNLRSNPFKSFGHWTDGILIFFHEFYHHILKEKIIKGFNFIKSDSDFFPLWVGYSCSFSRRIRLFSSTGSGLFQAETATLQWQFKVFIGSDDDKTKQKRRNNYEKNCPQNEWAERCTDRKKKSAT